MKEKAASSRANVSQGGSASTRAGRRAKAVPPPADKDFGDPFEELEAPFEQIAGAVNVGISGSSDSSCAVGFSQHDVLRNWDDETYNARENLHVE